MKKLLLKSFALLMVLAVSAMLMTACGGKNTADTVIKGTIYTVDENGTTAEAVAVKDGKITYVGDAAGAEEFIGDDTEVIETGDGIAMPSFTEAHAHGIQGGYEGLYEALLYECESYDEYLDTMKDFMKDVPEGTEFVKGTGWINGYTPAGGPLAKDLDKVTGDIPTILVSGDHHAYWVNTACLKEVGLLDTDEDIDGVVRDADGNPTGLLQETAKDLVDKKIPDYTVEQYKEAILVYQQEAVTYGITAYFEPMVNLNGSENMLKAYNELDDEGKLLINVYGGYQVVPGDDIDEFVDTVTKAKEEAEGGMFEILAVKILTDGVVEGHTAYLLEDYADAKGDRGKPEFDDDYLKELYLKLQNAGIQVHAHCIGDAAVRQTVDALEYVAEETGKTDCRHAITHLQVVNKDDIKRMGELNIVAVTNPYWFEKEPGYFYEVEVPYLGEDRANHEYPEKDFFDAGCVVTTGSDYPVTIPPAPLAAIQVGATRCWLDGDKDTLLGKDQIVTVAQMVKSATYNGAYQNFAEDKTGSLEVGKNADIIILDKDIMNIDPLEISNTKVLRTILNGSDVYTAK